jgi:putative transposase
LAVKGKALGRKALSDIATIVTPDTILRWHRQLVAAKWDYHEKRQPGRPRVSEEISRLVLKMAKENPTWGYDRIQGALANLGHQISDSTVGNLLKANGIEPAPDRQRKTSWKTFLKAHWEVLAAVDFTTVEVWTKSGLTTYYLLFAIRLASRRVCFAGMTLSPHSAWMQQVARNLTDSIDGFLNGSCYLLLDRDTKYSEAFCEILRQEQIKIVRLPPRSPNLNAHLERFMGSLKSEALARMIFFGEHSLHATVK